jgi:hypothetical protein
VQEIPARDRPIHPQIAIFALHPLMVLKVFAASRSVWKFPKSPLLGINEVKSGGVRKTEIMARSRRIRGSSCLRAARPLRQEKSPL